MYYDPDYLESVGVGGSSASAFAESQGYNNDYGTNFQLDYVNPVHIVGGVASGFDNFFTGNRDYNRQLALNEINNAFSASEAEKAWKRSEQSAEKAFERQKELAQNEYTYRIADLRRNGINPYVALGQGASVPGTPAGSAYQASASGSGSQHSSSGLGSLIASLFGSAFKLANAIKGPQDYTDYYSNDEGLITGARTRIYS